MENKLRIGIVASQFNKTIAARLIQSARRALKNHPATELACVIRVPGAFEIPLAAMMLAENDKTLDAIVCLGAIIQGQTDQNSHLASSCFQTLQQTQLKTGTPMALGIICAKNLKQALARTQGELDRGKEAAEAAIAMAQLKRRLQASKSSGFKVSFALN